MPKGSGGAQSSKIWQSCTARHHGLDLLPMLHTYQLKHKVGRVYSTSLVYARESDGRQRPLSAFDRQCKEHRHIAGAAAS